MPKPCETVHPEPAGGCRLCWLAVHVRSYQRHWGLPETGEHDRPSASPEPVAACRFVGDDLTGPERQAAGLEHSRRWLHCLHPDAPLGPHVCPCRGCGPKCPGYLSATA